MKNPKTNQISSLMLAGLLAAPMLATAASPVGGHYPVGAEGIKSASLPPPGLYFKDYNFLYFSDSFKGGPPDFSMVGYVNAPRLIYIADVNFLGANYGLDVIVPFANMDWRAGGTRSDHFGVGDIQFEPLLLAWHFKQLDLAAGYAVWAPTGDFSPARPDLISKGCWSHMLTVGGTWYPDQEKTWSFSALNRYEFFHKQDETNIEPGQAYTLELGIGKSLRKTLDLGVIGYWQQQTTKDGNMGAYNKLDRKFGVGPEISMFCPKLKMFASLRYGFEFGAKERPEGHLIALTIVKPL